MVRSYTGGKNDSQRAFTLVELLIVIAIITVLIAMLFPALNATRRQANAVQCSSNLRQIGQWGMIYAADWNGVLPTNELDNSGFVYTTNGASPSNNATAGGWGDISTTMWSQKAGPPYNLYQTDNSGNALTSGTALFCPDAAAQFQPMHASAQVGTNYALNIFLGGGEAFGVGSTAPNIGKVIVSRIPKIGMLNSQEYWFCDGGFRVLSPLAFHGYWGVMGFGTGSTFLINSANNPITWPWSWNYSDCANQQYLSTGHPNHTANFLYGDGHVSTLTRKEYLDTILPYNDQLETFTGLFY